MMSPLRIRSGVPVLVSVALASLFAASVAGRDRTGGAPIPPTDTVAPAALQTLLPAPDGWTKARAGSEVIALSPQTSYASANVLFTKDTMTLRVTLADTGGVKDTLISLATMVMTLPEDYSEVVPPATTIKRSVFKGSPAAEMWDSANAEGEFVVVVGGRFVARVEGSHLDAADTLRSILALVDLKKLAELK